MKEDGDSIVSVPQLRTGLSLTLPLSFVPLIRISLPSPLLAPLCRFGASLLGLPLEGNLVRISISPPRLFWLRVLVRQAVGRGGGFVLCLGHPPVSLPPTIFAVGWV